MKKFAFTLFLALSAFLAGPSFANDTTPSKKIDVDLTKMSGTVVYAMVNQMVTYPVRFKGKHIKMQGFFSSYYDEEIERRFYGCVIKDALACCSQGLAFELSKPRKYPDEYPAEGDAIVVEGDFDYEKDEGGGGFPIIRNAIMKNE